MALHRTFSSSAHWRMYFRLRSLVDAFLRRSADVPLTSGADQGAMPQLYPELHRIPISETCLWEQFDDEQNGLSSRTLARLLVQATRDKQQEQTK